MRNEGSGIQSLLARDERRRWQLWGTQGTGKGWRSGGSQWSENKEIV